MPWQKVPHEFTSSKLNYDSRPNYQPCIKISVFFKKIASIDYDTFFNHWRAVHADLVVATQAFQNNIVRYAQVRCLNFRGQSETKQTLMDGLHTASSDTRDERASCQSGEKVLDYDGCAELWVKTWEDWLAFYKSKEYAAALSDDCDRFMALPMTYMVGYENLVVGDASREMGGSDGMTQRAFEV